MEFFTFFVIFFLYFLMDVVLLRKTKSIKKYMLIKMEMFLFFAVYLCLLYSIISNVTCDIMKTICVMLMTSLAKVLIDDFVEGKDKIKQILVLSLLMWGISFVLGVSFGWENLKVISITLSLAIGGGINFLKLMYDKHVIDSRFNV